MMHLLSGPGDGYLRHYGMPGWRIA